MYYKGSTPYVKDDADFDDIEDFDYIGNFVDEDDTEMAGEDIDPEEIDDLNDLFLNDNEEDEYEEDEEDEEDLYLISDENKIIEVHLVCESCGHKWLTFMSEEEFENDYGTSCPLCGSADCSRSN